MSASNNSTNDTLLAEFYMDDFNRMVQQDKRALQARNNKTASQPNAEEKVADKFDTKEESPLEKRPFDSAAFYAWAKGPIQKEDTPVNNKKTSSPFRLRTF